MRPLAGILLIVAALFAASSKDKAGENDVDPQGTAAIAEQAERDRAGRKSKVYADVAAKLEAGGYADGASIIADIEKGLRTVEESDASPLQEDAARFMPTGKIENPEAARQWLEAVSEGLARVEDG